MSKRNSHKHFRVTASRCKRETPSRSRRAVWRAHFSPERKRRTFRRRIKKGHPLIKREKLDATIVIELIARLIEPTGVPPSPSPLVGHPSLRSTESLHNWTSRDRERRTDQGPVDERGEIASTNERTNRPISSLRTR